MGDVNSAIRDLWHDFDARERNVRELVTRRLAAHPAPEDEDSIVATYFFALRRTRIGQAADEIAYHATSGAKHPPAGSLLAACTARAVGVDEFDSTGRLGLLHVAFPLKMMVQPDGHVTSCDILH